MEDPREILRRIRRLELRTRARVEAAFSGQYRSVFKGRGMNFEEVREYQPGDEVRTIEWNVTARFGEVRGEAYVKKFTEERELSVVLVVDVSGSGDFGSVNQSKRELAAEVACVLAFSAIRNNDKVGLLLFSEGVELYMPPRRGRRHALRVVREILFFEPQGRGTNLSFALERLNRFLHRRSVVFLLSDFQAPDFSRQLGLTARRHDLVAMPLSDPREEVLPQMGTVCLEDAETGELLEVSTSDPEVRAAFAKVVEERGVELQRALRRMRVDSVPLRTDRDWMPALRSFFRNREHRLGART
ncbi:MAG: hypothetical protein RLZZ244_476 [Verrucomicrobiota bacterium]|jgi:uncharacterized protein (DUF58 family)